MLKSSYEQFIHASRYARYSAESGRRETWEETVDRYINFFKARNTEVKGIPWKDLRDAILNCEVVPSMRALMTAGPALDRDNVAGYNCAYLPVDKPRAFDETMYILMCGTGVGFSVERQYINKLPEIPDQLRETDTVVEFGDSKIGWSRGFRELIHLLYAGNIPRWDLSKIRAAGARLETFGGRASGPEPLEDLLRFTVSTFRGARGRRLTSLECHDLMCKIGEVVVVGGVRRSALISLSNLTDDRMRHAKHGDWATNARHRSLANNSVAFTEKPDAGSFLREWTALYDSKSGERGIFSRPASQAVAARNGRRDASWDFGCNPCSEIILRPNQFCNLTECVIRATDELPNIFRKVRLATILGTLQATLTDFRYLSKDWRVNTEEERLLGVSLTGIMDHPFLSGREAPVKELLANALKNMRDVAIDTNKKFAAKVGIPVSTAITCVKPSGTVSQLVDSSSGIHPRYSSYYIRNVRMDRKDPLSDWMLTKGFKAEDDFYNPSSLVFSFPMKAPEGAYDRNSMSALEQLELWKMYAENWCEHKPSQTVYVREDEWLSVGAWVYDNFDIVSGISFLPHSDHTYRQAPYIEVTQDDYTRLVGQLPRQVDWSSFRELGDNTTGSQEFACVGNSCEI